jgi:predicted N-acetyltransferase YhbS
VELDRFFREFAGQNQFRHHIGATYVAIDDATNRIVGYASVASGSIELDRIPVRIRKKLPLYPLPILRLARLAVDTSAKGQGIGSELLWFVLTKIATNQQKQTGCVGVVVDAYASAVPFYVQFGFEALDAVEGMSMTRPPTTEMLLPMKEILASMPEDDDDG